MTTPPRRHLPDTRPSTTHKRTICDFEVYTTVGFYDGHDVPAADACDPAEVFVKLSKHGTELSGLLDGWAVTLSVALQHGVPWEKLREKYLHTRFGTVTAEHSSLLDGLAKVVDFLVADRHHALGVPLPKYLRGPEEEPPAAPVEAPKPPPSPAPLTASAPVNIQDLTDAQLRTATTRPPEP